MPVCLCSLAWFPVSTANLFFFFFLHNFFQHAKKVGSEDWLCASSITYYTILMPWPHHYIMMDKGPFLHHVVLHHLCCRSTCMPLTASHVCIYMYVTQPLLSYIKGFYSVISKPPGRSLFTIASCSQFERLRTDPHSFTKHLYCAIRIAGQNEPCKCKCWPGL